MLLSPFQTGSPDDTVGFTGTLLESALLLDPAVTAVPVPVILAGLAVFAVGFAGGLVGMASDRASAAGRRAFGVCTLFTLVGGGALVGATAITDSVPLEESAQTWAQETYGVTVADDAQDELYLGEPVTGTFNGESVTVRLVETDVNVGHDSVFVLVDDATGDMFGDTE